MTAIPHDTVIQQLQWRYATKKFDPARKIDPQLWCVLEQALVLSPSSYGLQPWRFVVVTNPQVRARLREAARNQPQITDASHLVVFALRKGLGPADVERHLQQIMSLRGVSADSLAMLRSMMLAAVGRPAEQTDAWAARQVYIALGTFLTLAALLGVDACPMEGFEPPRFDEILGLAAEGYASVVLAAAGYRAADDPYARVTKVRFNHDDVVIRMS